jgi:hypothetical protein
MLVTRLVAAFAATATLVVGLTAPASAKDDTPPPVVVDDTIALYPFQSRTIDLLANDSSPTGQELRLCRFPEQDFDTPGSEVFAYPTGNGGEVQVMVFGFTGEDATIEYFVCDETHLTRATLTVDVRDTAPVEVVRTGKPGQLRVTNTNEAKVVFKWGAPRGNRPDGKVTIAAGGTELVTVTRTRIVWVAMIGRGGVADHGRVTGIKPVR